MENNTQERESRIKEALELIDRMTDDEIIRLLCIFALESEAAS